MSRQLRVMAVVVLVGAWCMPLDALAMLVKPSNASIRFVAAGPAGVSIVGESSDLRLHDDGQFVVLTAPLAPLHTGIGLRDRHMKEKYLEVAKYPNAELRIDRKTIQFPAAGSKLNREGAGELTLHGHQKHVKFRYEATRDGAGFDVSATFRLNVKEYAIDVPSYLGVTVKPDVDVSVHFHVTDG
jgi:hypothetical protein